MKVATGLLLGAGPAWASDESTQQDQEEISPGEDLMREHGVLERILLVYEEGLRQMRNKSELPSEPLAQGARIIRRFIEDYHEKLEEQFLFPRFEKAGKLVPLVQTLRAQHQAGRKLTDSIDQAASGGLKSDAARSTAANAIGSFIRMYRPHAAQEDTVLFPALHQIVSRHEYDAMGEDFEEREHELLGQDGFEGVVGQVARLEEKLGIADLAKFTPR